MRESFIKIYLFMKSYTILFIMSIYRYTTGTMIDFFLIFLTFLPIYEFMRFYSNIIKIRDTLLASNPDSNHAHRSGVDNLLESALSVLVCRWGPCRYDVDI